MTEPSDGQRKGRTPGPLTRRVRRRGLTTMAGRERDAGFGNYTSGGTVRADSPEQVKAMSMDASEFIQRWRMGAKPPWSKEALVEADLRPGVPQLILTPDGTKFDTAKRALTGAAEQLGLGTLLVIQRDDEVWCMLPNEELAQEVEERRQRHAPRSRRDSRTVALDVVRGVLSELGDPESLRMADFKPFVAEKSDVSDMTIRRSLEALGYTVNDGTWSKGQANPESHEDAA